MLKKDIYTETKYLRVDSPSVYENNNKKNGQVWLLVGAWFFCQAQL
jgi:hypothetical protein